MLINLTNIFKSYVHKGEKIQVLGNVNLKVEKSEKVAVMGRNGSGKTTLLNIIGIIDTPDSGEYMFKNRKLPINKPLKLHKLRRNHFGYIPQRLCLIQDKKGFYNVSLPLLFRGYTKDEIKEKVDEISSFLDIRHLLNKKPINMSSGECQKISIARALIADPEIILADELTSALDDESRDAILNFIMSSVGLTVIIATHDGSIANNCDRILYLEENKISEF